MTTITPCIFVDIEALVEGWVTIEFDAKAEAEAFVNHVRSGAGLGGGFDFPLEISGQWTELDFDLSTARVDTDAYTIDENDNHCPLAS